MGIGFIIIIVLLATLLGLFARQALSAADEPVESNETDQDGNNNHPHAI